MGRCDVGRNWQRGKPVQTLRRHSHKSFAVREYPIVNVLTWGAFGEIQTFFEFNSQFFMNRLDELKQIIRIYLVNRKSKSFETKQTALFVRNLWLKIVQWAIVNCH